MDSLALLCNLHGDGPETLRRLRRAGVSDLRTLFALGLEGIEPLLGRDRSAASRFLREARLLEQRQVLADAEEPLAGGQAVPGGRAEPVPAGGSEPGRAPAGVVSLPTEHALSGRAGAADSMPAEEALADEQFVDYVLAPRSHPGGEGEPPSAEPRHSVLAALLAAWSRGDGGLENRSEQGGEEPGSERAGALGRSAPNGAGAEPSAGPLLAPKANGVHARPVGDPARVERPLPGPIQLAQFLQPSAVEPGLERSIESLRRNRSTAEPGEAAGAAGLDRGRGVREAAAREPGTGIDPAMLAAAGASDAGRRSPPEVEPASRAVPSAPATPLARLAAEQVDPAALDALAQAGPSSLEDLLAGEPRELSRASGLPYTLLLRLQYLARRCLRGLGQ